MKVVILLPTYNERENISTILNLLREQSGLLKNHTLQYLVVDDNSPDGTSDVVRAYKKEHKDVHIITGAKKGLGAALLRGMTYAVDELKAEILLQMDADLSHDPRNIVDLLKKIDQGSNFVVGSRYIPGGSIPQNWGVHRKIFSIVGNSIVRFGLGFPEVHDWTGGFRAFHKDFFIKNKIKMLKYSGYVFQIAFLHNAIIENAKVSEVPIHFTDRRFGHSKIAPSEYIRNVFEYVIRARIKRTIHGAFGKFLVVGTIGFVINTIVLEIFVHIVNAHPSIGSAIGAEFAIFSNFILNNAWTFGTRKVNGWKKVPKFLQFNLSSLGAVIIQAGTVYVGTHIFSESVYRHFYLIGVGFGMIWNYFMYSRVIWKKIS